MSALISTTRSLSHSSGLVGCGKTTTLRIIGGFETPDSGAVYFDGKEINDLPPYKRLVNTVFQKYALFPHLNVYENIAFGLRLKKSCPRRKSSGVCGKCSRWSTSRALSIAA